MNYTRYLLLLFGVMALASCRQEKLDVTFSSLLEEMVDYEEAARFPALPFSCRQESSYDRRSIHPDSAGWFANNDGFGYREREKRKCSVRSGRSRRYYPVLADNNG